MNPLGVVVTADGKYLITSNNDELDIGFESYQNPQNIGAYSLSVIDTKSMKVVSTTPVGSTTGSSLFIGLQVTGSGPYTLWASGGADSDVKVFPISAAGVISAATSIPVAPITPLTRDT